MAQSVGDHPPATSVRWSCGISTTGTLRYPSRSRELNPWLREKVSAVMTFGPKSKNTGTAQSNHSHGSTSSGELSDQKFSPIFIRRQSRIASVKRGLSRLRRSPSTTHTISPWTFVLVERSTSATCECWNSIERPYGALTSVICLSRQVPGGQPHANQQGNGTSIREAIPFPAPTNGRCVVCWRGTSAKPFGRRISAGQGSHSADNHCAAREQRSADFCQQWRTAYPARSFYRRNTAPNLAGLA